MDSSGGNRALVRTYLEAYAAQDVEMFVELTADAMVASGINLNPRELLVGWDWETLAILLVEDVVDTSWSVDCDAAVEDLQEFADGVSLKDLTIDHLTAVAPDAFAYHITPTYTHDGVISGSPPTGNNAPFPEVGAVHVEDGEVVSHLLLNDFRVFCSDLGILPQTEDHARTEVQFRQVVNRVLRHNLRTALNVALMHLDDLPDADRVDAIRDPLEELQEISEKIRAIEAEIHGPTEVTAVTLPAVVESVVMDLQDAHPGTDVSVTRPDGRDTITSKRPLVRLAVREALQNVVEHTQDTTPDVTITVPPPSSDSDDAVIAISDTGPGIPDYELQPLSQDHEDALEHASGIGLWAIKWSLDQLGGDVEFTDNDPHGSVVRLHLPDMD